MHSSIYGTWSGVDSRTTATAARPNIPLPPLLPPPEMWSKPGIRDPRTGCVSSTRTLGMLLNAETTRSRPRLRRGRHAESGAGDEPPQLQRSDGPTGEESSGPRSRADGVGSLVEDLRLSSDKWGRVNRCTWLTLGNGGGHRPRAWSICCPCPLLLGPLPDWDRRLLEFRCPLCWGTGCATGGKRVSWLLGLLSIQVHRLSRLLPIRSRGRPGPTLLRIRYIHG